MFFISDLDINELFSADLIYIPTYQPNREIMWSGIFGIKMPNIDLALNFKPQVIPNTDTFGQSILLTSDSKYTKKIFDLYMIGSVTDTIIKGGINNDCSVEFDNDKIILWNKPFEFPIEKLNESNKMVNRFHDIYNLVKKYDFPEPYNIDFIDINGVQTLVHFKSSNWCEWYTEDYVTAKKNSLIKLLNDIK